MSTTGVSPETADKTREDWIRTVTDLAGQVEVWVQGEPGWRVTSSEREVTESLLGTYRVPVLEINFQDGRLILEPIARAVIGADGRVDLYAWPTLFQVMLLYKAQSSWVVRTNSGIDWPQPWGRETFFALAKGLLGAE